MWLLVGSYLAIGLFMVWAAEVYACNIAAPSMGEHCADTCAG
jgi:hypothetical protein